MFRNILVAVDGSVHADEALRQAIDLAESEHATLTLLTAAAPPPPFAVFAGAPIPDTRAEAEDILDRALTTVPPDIPVTTIVTAEPIRPALIHQIHDGRHDLVVMGSRGRGALRAVALGSVSHYALHHSHVPVLIIHTDPQHQEETPLKPAASNHA
jgi:nucleotide-binding universal stress UspA family protein